VTGSGREDPIYDPEPVVAEVYDYVTQHVDRPDVAFYVDLADEVGGPILEVGCGTGRVLLPTARRGHAITGLDDSARMLAVLRGRLEEEPADVRGRVTVVEGDMRDFEAGGPFALVTLPFRPFQHLTATEDQLACLAAVRRHLAPGALLALDVFDPDLEMLVQETPTPEFGQEPPFHMPDGRRVIRKHRVRERDLRGQVSRCEISYYVGHENGNVDKHVHRFPMRHVFRWELEHLLERSGFGVERVYGDFQRAPYGEGQGGEIIMVARRR
jgi:SAM-dependent methyltransferase